MKVFPAIIPFFPPLHLPHFHVYTFRAGEAVAGVTLVALHSIVRTLMTNDYRFVLCPWTYLESYELSNPNHRMISTELFYSEQWPKNEVTGGKESMAMIVKCSGRLERKKQKTQ